MMELDRGVYGRIYIVGVIVALTMRSTQEQEEQEQRPRHHRTRKPNNPLLIAATAVVGLIVFPDARAGLGDGQINRQ